MSENTKSVDGRFKHWFLVVFTLLSIAVCITAVIVTFVLTFDATNKDEIEKKLMLYSSLIKNDVEEGFYSAGANDEVIAGRVFYMLSDTSDNDLIEMECYSFNGEEATCFKEQNEGVFSRAASEFPHKDSLLNDGYVSWLDEETGKHVSVLTGLFSPDGELFGAIQMTYKSNSFNELYTKIIWRIAIAYAAFVVIVILFAIRWKKPKFREGGISI